MTPSHPKIQWRFLPEPSADAGQADPCFDRGRMETSSLIRNGFRFIWKSLTGFHGKTDGSRPGEKLRLLNSGIG